MSGGLQDIDIRFPLDEDPKVGSSNFSLVRLKDQVFAQLIYGGWDERSVLRLMKWPACRIQESSINSLDMNF